MMVDGQQELQDEDVEGFVGWLMIESFWARLDVLG